MSPSRAKLPRLLLVVVLGLALAGAAWSLDSSESCFGCGEKGKLIGRLPLPLIGTVFYALLLTAVAWGRLSRLSALGIQVAASVHLVVLGLLAWNRLVCPPCILTGAAALIAATLLFLSEPQPSELERAVSVALGQEQFDSSLFTRGRLLEVEAARP